MITVTAAGITVTLLRLSLGATHQDIHWDMVLHTRTFIAISLYRAARAWYEQSLITHYGMHTTCSPTAKWICWVTGYQPYSEVGPTYTGGYQAQAAVRPRSPHWLHNCSAKHSRMMIHYSPPPGPSGQCCQLKQTISCTRVHIRQKLNVLPSGTLCISVRYSNMPQVSHLGTQNGLQRKCRLLQAKTC